MQDPTVTIPRTPAVRPAAIDIDRNLRVDPAEAELRALSDATTALGDRLAIPPTATPPETSAGTRIYTSAALRDHTDRRALTDPDAIVEAMAFDVFTARREGQIGLIDLTEAGWAPTQVMRWSSQAHQAASSEALVAQHAVEILRDRDAIDLDTLGGTA